ncbi:hypothetical protein DPEC_G00064270 [Dallia pectoralis]|uniref:Uncharacterized protein n=1 Tax=Dallia pectoralis TaxID=75939 RepID=A0ACC2H8B3_DALPE|nr:hypothetical protein DPEC_G00064270 [Dallia pectoralis]
MEEVADHVDKVSYVDEPAVFPNPQVLIQHQSSETPHRVGRLGNHQLPPFTSCDLCDEGTDYKGLMVFRRCHN